jgi:YHS domain-containing protein
LAEPERYAPVYRGQDPVLLLDECRRVEGHPDYCVTYAGRLYSFSCEKTLERFQQSPEKYAVPSDR